MVIHYHFGIVSILNHHAVDNGQLSWTIKNGPSEPRAKRRGSRLHLLETMDSKASIGNSRYPGERSTTHSLKLRWHLKIGRIPKGNDSIATIYFQGQTCCSFQGGYLDCQLYMPFHWSCWAKNRPKQAFLSLRVFHVAKRHHCLTETGAKLTGLETYFLRHTMYCYQKHW